MKKDRKEERRKDKRKETKKEKKESFQSRRLLFIFERPSSKPALA